MKLLKHLRRIERRRTVALRWSVLTVAMLMAGRFAWAGGIVTSCTETNLRAALAGGGTVTFACDGVITAGGMVISVDTILDASGHQVTISGNNEVGVFYLNTNVALALVNLTVTAGYNANGAGLLNAGGSVTLVGVTFQNNVAQLCGGAITSSGTVCATNCIFSGNDIITGAYVVGYPPATVNGGAIESSGPLTLENCAFTNNQVVGANSLDAIWSGGTAGGGAIYCSGTTMIDSCAFALNSASGGNGGGGSGQAAVTGGPAQGGAIYNSGTLTLSRSSLTGNRSSGGMGGAGSVGTEQTLTGASGGDASGGAIYNAGTLELQSSTLAGNRATGGNGGAGVANTRPAGGEEQGGGGGNGGAAVGGAIYNAGVLYLQSSTMAGNGATGGNGNTAGAGSGSRQGAPGGSGGNGGLAVGALYNGGAATLVSDTVAGNSGGGGNGGAGGAGGQTSVPDWPGGSGGGGGNGGSGIGGIYEYSGQYSGQLRMTNCTLASNSGNGGGNGSGGPGGLGIGPAETGAAGTNGSSGTSVGGINSSPSCLCVNTLLSGNTANNCVGSIMDAGHNLSSDASCAFTNSGSMNNTDPKLGPLANNGGPTLTLALLSGSPAIDAGLAVGAPATDQRGVPRPQGPGVDIGAFEVQSVPFFSGVAINCGTNFQLQMTGYLPSQSFTLQGSSNLVDWFTVTGFTPGTNWNTLFVDSISTNGRTRFYRVKSAAP